MGVRGPLSKDAQGKKAERGPRTGRAITVPAARLPDAPPPRLGEHGCLVWHEVAALSWVQSTDALAALRLCELEDERAELTATIAADGRVLDEPIVTPSGILVGHRKVVHPLQRELRRLDAEIAGLRKELGASPMSRARLGVRLMEISKASGLLERLTARADDVIDIAPDGVL